MVLDILLSLLNPRKFSRTWTSEDKDKDKDLKIGPLGSSRTFLEDNNAGLVTHGLLHFSARVLSADKRGFLGVNGTLVGPI